ncbi:MAG: hypothetical protein GY820_40240 [Gammaproteobacteria bacterium]|nr:hypothetical protein [Gammaproteobacteria bacterium]
MANGEQRSVVWRAAAEWRGTRSEALLPEEAILCVVISCVLVSVYV